MTANPFKIIVITSPEPVENEASKLTCLLDAGVDFIHIRKPDTLLREVKDLIENIPFEYRKKLRLHGHFQLVNEMNLAGVHLNGRNPIAPATALSISKSVHSIAELDNISDFDYVTLSPIYDSISKVGYKTKFELDKIGKSIKGKRVVALGGIRPENIQDLKDVGFYGAAFMGYVWNNDFPSAVKNIKVVIGR